MRRDAALSKLTEDQQADLYDWLCSGTFEAVRARIAKKPPEGLGIKTHVTSLVRFFRARQTEIQALDFAETAEGAEGHLGSIEAAMAASKRALVHSMFVLAHSPGSAEHFPSLARVIQRNEYLAIKREFLQVAQRQVALARERLEFQRRQFEYNAARAALSALPELVAIDEMKQIDDEAKIWRVRERLFGQSASASVATERIEISK
jgi:hypothetical protein